MDLNNKVIAITGAGRGLGRSMALTLAAKGAKLALIDLNQEDLDTTLEQVREAGSDGKTYICNVAQETEVEAVFAAIPSDLGGINGLINNAGITRDRLFIKVKEGEIVSKMTMDQWNLVMDVNLTGTFLCGREAAVQMIQHKQEGCIINISSISRHGNMGQTNYTATKAAVEAMAVTWAKELARYGIRAASIAPGYIGTEMVMSMKQEARDKIAAGIPAKRLGRPDEIAATAVFILENDYASGRCFEVDGGLRI